MRDKLEKWCVYQNRLGFWEMTLSNENEGVPDGRPVKFFSTQQESFKFLQYMVASPSMLKPRHYRMEPKLLSVPLVGSKII